MFLLIIIVIIAALICAGIYFFIAPVFKLAEDASEPLEGEYDAKVEIGHC